MRHQSLIFIKYKCVKLAFTFVRIKKPLYIVLLQLHIPKDTLYKIKNQAFLIIVYNHLTSLRQDQSVAVATTSFA